MSLESEFFNSGLVLKDGTRWVGDESNGFPEVQFTKKPDHPVQPVLEERSYFEQFGGGKPNLE